MIFYRLLMCLICSTSVSPSIKLAECRLLFWGGQCLPLRAWAWHLQMVDNFPLLLRRTQCCRLPPAVLRNLAPGGVTRRLSVTGVGNPVIYHMTASSGARVAVCRACRTAQHTAATCPLGGGASSQLPSLPPAAVPAVVPPPALPSALPIALAPPAPPSRRTFAGRPADGIGAAAVGPFSDLTVTFATESHDSNPSLSNYFSSSVTSAP